MLFLLSLALPPPGVSSPACFTVELVASAGLRPVPSHGLAGCVCLGWVFLQGITGAEIVVDVFAQQDVVLAVHVGHGAGARLRLRVQHGGRGYGGQHVPNGGAGVLTAQAGVDPALQHGQRDYLPAGHNLPGGGPYL